MPSISQLVTFIAVIATVHGITLNTTTGPDDYFLAAQRELIRDIDLVELQISFADARYADRLDVIKIQQQQMLDEIIQFNQTHMLLQTLSSVRKHCIQNYATLLTPYDAAKLQFKTCNDRVEKVGGSLTNGARVYVNSARSTTNFQFPKNIDGCGAYRRNQTRLELCYIDCVESTTLTVQRYLTQARDQLDRSANDAKTNVKSAVECSYSAEKLIWANMTMTTRMVDDCQTSLSQQGLRLIETNAPKLFIGEP